MDQDTDEKVVTYQLLWYKKQGGAVLKSFDLSRLSVVRVLDSPRGLSYVGKELNKGGSKEEGCR